MKQIAPIIFAVAIAGCARQPVDVAPAGESFLPLAVGNRWVFEMQKRDVPVASDVDQRDTVSISAKATVQGTDFFKLQSSWPGFGNGLWVYRATNGNVFVAPEPEIGGSAFLVFDAEVGQRWPLDETIHGCLNSLALLDDYAVVNTPAGRFDGAREIGGGWIDCSDFGWTADFARGVGPVRWEAITIAGPINWLLIDAVVEDDFAGTLSTNAASDD